MANWLDLSNNANCFESMYVKGFVDMSGGSLQLRNADNHLLVGGDASFNGGVYLGGTKMGDSDELISITFTGGVNNQIGQVIVGEAAGDYSGSSVSLSNDGTIVAIGAMYNHGTSTSDAGHTRIYQYDSRHDIWNQLGQDIDGEAANDYSGYSVSLSNDGTIVAIGARFNHGTTTDDAGHVRIYQYDSRNDIWNQLGQDIDGEVEDDRSGYSVSLSGDGTIVAIGAPYNDGTNNSSSYNCGHVRIHQYDSDKNVWNQLGQDIDGESKASGDNSGWSVSLSNDGTIVAIGATYNDGTGPSNAGHVRVYQYDSGNNIWNQLGQDIDGEANNDWSGTSVSLSNDGTIVAIGANLNDGNGNSAGHVRIYQYDSGNNLWNQVGQDIDSEASDDYSGSSVSLSNDGTIVAIGAHYNDGTGASNAGHVRIYQYDSGNNLWNQLGQDIDGEGVNDYLGYSVSLNGDGTIVAIGAYQNDGTGASNAGHVRIYEIANEKTYVQVIKQIPLQLGIETQRLGYAVDISGIVDISGTLFTQGDVSMNGNLYVSGDTTIDGTLTIPYASIPSSNVVFSSDVSMNDRLFVNAGDISYNKLYDYLKEVIFPDNPSITLLGTDINGDGSSDKSGWSVSLSNDGTIVAIGAPYEDGNGGSSGHVRVYQYNGSSWSQLGQDIDGEAASNESGYSVSLSNDGTIVAIGATLNDGTGATDTGHARIYQYNGSSWNQLGQDIDGEAAGDYSGHSVSLSGDGTIVAIGANKNDGNGTWAGHTRVYQYDSDNNLWNQLGQDIDGTSASDQSGYSVSLSNDGTVVAIGALYDDVIGASNAGRTLIYQYSNSSWNQLGQNIDGEAASDQSGSSVSLSNDGTIVAIGAPNNDGNGDNSGHTRIYQYDSDNDIWNQLGQDIDGKAAGDKLGWSVSLSGYGTIVAIGAYLNDDNGTWAGHTRVYQYDSDNNLWNQIGDDINGQSADDKSGHSVSLSNDGTIVAIGAPQRDGNGSDAGHVRVYEIEHNINYIPIYQTIHSDVNSSGTFSTDISLNNSLIVPSNITVVDSSSNNYGSYTVYTDKAATSFFSVGKSASHVFNIVDQDNAGVYMASGSTSLTSTSDVRLKTAIEPLEDATNRLMQLNPCTYKWKTQDEADSKKHVGFIAQEVEALFPNLVNENTYPDGSTYKGVATTDMIPYLLKTSISMDEQLVKMEEYIKSKKST